MPSDTGYSEMAADSVPNGEAPVEVPSTEIEATEFMSEAQEMAAAAHESVSESYEAVAAVVDLPVVVAESTVSAINTGMAEAKAGMVTTQKKVKENMDKAMRTAQDFVSFSQGNFEAMIKSGQIWAAGVQELGKQVAATAQAHYDESMSVFKAMTSVKSLKEAFELQSGLARTSMEKAVSETGRLTDASLKLAEEAIAPLTARMTLAVETFSKAV